MNAEQSLNVAFGARPPGLLQQTVAQVFMNSFFRCLVHWRNNQDVSKASCQNSDVRSV